MKISIVLCYNKFGKCGEVVTFRLHLQSYRKAIKERLELKMKKNKFGIIWLIIIFESFIISASMSPTNYFTYTFQNYFVYPLP